MAAKVESITVLRQVGELNSAIGPISSWQIFDRRDLPIRYENFRGQIEKSIINWLKSNHG